jgi:hypothetical protein
MDWTAWYPFQEGSTIGQSGSEDGVVVRDEEEHPLGARVTLEGNTPTAPFTITCGIYGWMFHTRFFSAKAEADAEYESMRDALASILDVVPEASEAEEEEKMNRVHHAITAFLEKFP